nr:hypothetical protein [Tanacetum cinerariifolium]
NAELSAFLGEDFGHVDHGRLGHRVDALKDPRRYPVDRCYVDDAAAAVLAHQLAGFDRHEEVAPDVHIDGFLERAKAIAVALPPSATIASATCWQPSILRLETMTWAPCCASSLAIASPIPRLAPETKAILPSRSNNCVLGIPSFLVVTQSKGRTADHLQGHALQQRVHVDELREALVPGLAVEKAVVDLLNDAGEAKQAVGVIKVEVVDADARALDVVRYKLLSGEHARRMAGLASHQLHRRRVVRLNPVRQAVAQVHQRVAQGAFGPAANLALDVALRFAQIAQPTGAVIDLVKLNQPFDKALAQGLGLTRVEVQLGRPWGNRERRRAIDSGCGTRGPCHERFLPCDRKAGGAAQIPARGTSAGRDRCVRRPALRLIEPRWTGRAIGLRVSGESSALIRCVDGNPRQCADEKKPKPGSFGFLHSQACSGRKQLAQFHRQHHVAFSAQLAAHESLHAVGLAADDAFQGFTVHHQRHLCVRVLAFLQLAGAVLDDQREVLGVVDAEPEHQRHLAVSKLQLIERGVDDVPVELEGLGGGHPGDQVEQGGDGAARGEHSNPVIRTGAVENAAQACLHLFDKRLPALQRGGIVSAAQPAGDDRRKQALKFGAVIPGVTHDIQRLGLIFEHRGEQRADHALGVELVEGDVGFKLGRGKAGCVELGNDRLRRVALAKERAADAPVEGQTELRKVCAENLRLAKTGGRQNVVIVCTKRGLTMSYQIDAAHDCVILAR